MNSPTDINIIPAGIRKAFGVAPAPQAPASLQDILTEGKRPRTVAETAALGRKHGHPGAFFREFLDEWNKLDSDSDRLASVDDEPALTGDAKLDAWYGAAVEHLCFRQGLAPPPWTQEPCRFLKRAWFPHELQSLKALCLKESPTAFRRRMIFVDSHPLSRPTRSL